MDGSRLQADLQIKVVGKAGGLMAIWHKSAFIKRIRQTLTRAVIT